MAKRRMFSTDVVCNDKFINMPHIAQVLYFRLSMHTNNKGFCMLSNEELANCFKCNSNEIASGLHDLVINGYICIKMVIDDKQTKPIRMICVKEYYEKGL